MSSSEQPVFSLSIPLSLTKEDAAHHTSPEGGKLNNRNIRDESTDGFIIQASLDKVIHGVCDDLKTFIGLEFRFQGVDDRRRFQRVEVTIRFEDGDNPGVSDPEVIDLWPNKTHVWNQTSVGQENEVSGEVGAQGGTSAGGVSTKGKWGTKKTFNWADKATFSGNCVPRQNKVGTRNAALLTLKESRHGKSGVVSLIRTGVLLLRQKEGPHHFRAYFDIEAKADMRFRWLNGMKKLVSPPAKALLLEPGKNYYGIGDGAGIDGTKPDAAMVRKYGDAISWVELDPVREVKRKDGEWVEDAKSGEQGEVTEVKKVGDS